jgi:hypothetical protein
MRPERECSMRSSGLEPPRGKLPTRPSTRSAGRCWFQQRPDRPVCGLLKTHRTYLAERLLSDFCQHRRFVYEPRSAEFEPCSIPADGKSPRKGPLRAQLRRPGATPASELRVGSGRMRHRRSEQNTGSIPIVASAKPPLIRGVCRSAVPPRWQKVPRGSPFHLGGNRAVGWRPTGTTTKGTP